MIKLTVCTECKQEIAKHYILSIKGKFVFDDRSYDHDGKEYGHLPNCPKFQLHNRPLEGATICANPKGDCIMHDWKFCGNTECEWDEGNMKSVAGGHMHRKEAVWKPSDMPQKEFDYYDNLPHEAGEDREKPWFQGKSNI
jgi:hypothetical protein